LIPHNRRAESAVFFILYVIVNQLAGFAGGGKRRPSLEDTSRMLRNCLEVFQVLCKLPEEFFQAEAADAAACLGRRAAEGKQD